RFDFSGYHLFWPFKEICIVGSSQSKRVDECNSLSSSGSATALGVVCGSRRDIPHEDTGRVANVHTHFHCWGANEHVGFATLEFLLYLYTARPRKLGRVFVRDHPKWLSMGIGINVIVSCRFRTVRLQSALTPPPRANATNVVSGDIPAPATPKEVFWY